MGDSSVGFRTPPDEPSAMRKQSPVVDSRRSNGMVIFINSDPDEDWLMFGRRKRQPAANRAILFSVRLDISPHRA